MIAQAVYAGNDLMAKRPQTVRAFLAGWYETVAFMRANKAATLPIAARRMDVSTAIAGRVYDELIDNFSTDGCFEADGLKVLVDSLIEMGAMQDPSVTALYTERFLTCKN
jgi:NitT/TauT family transport system substrate-binding protein